MKKILSLMLVGMLMVGILCIGAQAANASATLSGPDVVRAGDTITVTFKVNGTGILGLSGELEYDTSKLTLTSTSQKISSPWMVEFNGNIFAAYDNEQTKPINSNTSILTATFKVNANLATGTNITVSIKDVTTSDGRADTELGKISYSATIAAPKSTDNKLKSLVVSNATISPAFDPNVTSYTASVPFEVSKLDLNYQANDSKATVSVNNPTLTVNGTTNVTIKVTSESGSSKTYTIAVTRAQDPNYVPSGNNNLSGITVDGYVLSPGFTPENDRYIVWLPYETANITVRGTAADKLASVEVIGGSNLVAGQDNEIRVICTAENGQQKTYYVIAKRAAAHDTEMPAPEPEKYTVFWVVDGNVTMETYEAGAMPSFSGSTDKAADSYYSYSFAGWHQEIAAVTGDVTYVATYTKTVIAQPDDPGEPEGPGNDPTHPTDPTQPTTTQPAGNQQGNAEAESGGVSVLVAVLLAVLCAAAGIAAGFVIGKKKK